MSEPVGAPDAPVASPVPVSEGERHWLLETATCASCGLGVNRMLGKVGPRGGLERWESPSTWVHDNTLRAACDPSQVAWFGRQRVEEGRGE